MANKTLVVPERETQYLSMFLALGRIAQLVEQLTLNQRVQGSSPCAPTNKFNDFMPIDLFEKTSCPHYVRINVAL